MALDNVNGCLLDVGTGSGLLLKAVHKVRPRVLLYGLDISENAINTARKNLEGITGRIDLRVGSIEETTYEDDMFDVITSTASFIYWENPVACFDEIHRILKPGCSAILFEPQKDINIDEAIEIIDENLADASPFRRFAARLLNRNALTWGRRLGVKLYSVEEIENIATHSRFLENHSVERITILNLPIWVKITLTKQESNDIR